MLVWIFFLLKLAWTDDALQFLVLGDWGGLPTSPYTTIIEERTAKQMAVTARESSAHFIVALGDNFYYDGVQNEFDARFNKTYSSIYNQPSLQIPWYLIAGNHDHYGNVSAQIAFTQRSKLWNFPNYWFSKKWLLPDSNSTLRLVMIDTVLLCGNSGYDDNLIQPPGPEDSLVSELQWSWIEEQLSNSRDDYLLVGGHFPVWSVAEHGPTHCLVARLKPLLIKYNVTAYLCGHDHNLQHIHDKNVHYFVVGSANFIENSLKHKNSVPPESLKFFWADERSFGGFALLSGNKKSLQLTMIDSNGKLLHKQVMSPRNVL